MSTYDEVLRTQTRDLVRPTLQVFSFLYLVVTGAHLLLLQDDVVWFMVGLSGLSLLLGITLQFSLNYPLIHDNPELVLVLLVLVLGINSGAHLYVTMDVKQSTNFIFVCAVSGYILPSARWFYSVLVALVGGCTALLWLQLESPADAVHYSFALAMAAMLSMFLHTFRRRQLEQLASLEDTIGQLNSSQEQIVAGESIIRNLLENMPAGILVRDTDTRLLFTNATAREILGYGSRDVIGMKAGEDGLVLCDIHARPLTGDRLPVNRVLLQGEVIIDEVVGAIHENGDIRWGLLNAFPMEREEPSDQLIVLSFVDISRRILAERQLQDSEERAHAVLDSVREGILTVDENSIVTLINPAAAALTGFDVDEAIGQPLATIVSFTETVDEGREGLSSETLPRRRGKLLNRAGETIDVELIVSSISGAADKQGEVITVRDMREQLRIEQERATMDKMSSVGVLAGGIAHDFNNLLTAIYGNLSVAETTLDDPRKTRELLARSTRSITQATNLTNQLLTFARGSDPVREVIDAEKLVRDAAQFALSGSSTAVTFDVDQDLCSVEVDAGQMQQAISNVVLNAKQAMNDRGKIVIRLHNQIASTDEPEFVELSICDEGSGVDPDALPNIFDPYFTTKPSGTGLGLASAHSIVTKHGGSISVATTPEGGAIFTLLLPVGQKKGSPDLEIETPGDTGVKKLAVLVMDDDEIVRETFVDLLHAIGHDVVAVRDGESAISAYSERMQQGGRFDLVIMDLTIVGGMGGKEAAASVLEIDPAAKIIVSSGYSSGSEIAHYKSLGFAARLSKPFRVTDLQDVITETLKHG